MRITKLLGEGVQACLSAEGEGKLLDWLRFLKAETEEEFKMLAEKNPVIKEAYCK
jgi:hypothetical protein